MTSSELKYNHELYNGGSYFFSRDTMRFFGDTMRNYGVKDKGTYFELYRKSPVKHGMRQSAYFDKLLFKRINIEGA
jgi:hypothetical protein